jgi:hypothetical protein
MNSRQKPRASRDIRVRASWLAAWLNGMLPHAARQKRGRARVQRIIGLLQELQSALRPGMPLWKLPEVTRIETDLQKLTRRYRTWPRFAAASVATYIGVAHIWGHGLEEGIAFSLIEDLLKARLLNGLTFCETCKHQWVFRSGEKGKYCSTRCRQARYEATPERKLQKIKNAKRYYKQKLSSWRKQGRVR